MCNSPAPRPDVRRRSPVQRPRVEALDRRELPAAVAPAVVMLSATTLDSRSVTFSYRVDAPDPGLQFGVYRSASTQFDSGAVPVAAPIAAPALDASGNSSAAPGVHQVTIPLPGGLPINPKHPYVLVVADPASPSSFSAGETASFRKVVIGVVTHGGLAYDHWKKNGPPWELEMARSLRAQGYDEVIPYNWVAASGTPGAAARQGPKLAQMVLDAAAKLPANDVIDLHFIGHSEGAIVNTQAIVGVEAHATPQIRAGFLEDTLLDPHAANPDTPGSQYSTGGVLGWYAKMRIDEYQSKARDPLAFIPPEVDGAQVFYQQTPASKDHNENMGMYNLWGQVPVKGTADYFNLTADRVVHFGKNGVFAWYQDHVVPTLGNGGRQVAAETLTGALKTASAPGPTIKVAQATYAGKSAPGSVVTLLAGAAGPGRLEVVGRGIADGSGAWSVTSRPLADGRYRVVAEAHLEKSYPNDQPPVPTEPLGGLIVDAPVRPTGPGR